MSTFTTKDIPSADEGYAPVKKDVVFVQRSDDNSIYEQVNISGSDVVIVLGPDGHITAKKISDLVVKSDGAGLAGEDGVTVYVGPAQANTGKTGYLTFYSDPNVIDPTTIPTFVTKDGISIGKLTTPGFIYQYPQATLDILGNVYVSGSLRAWDISGSFRGLINSSSYTLTASYALNGGGGVADTASWSVTSSYAMDANIPYDGNRSIKRGPYTGLNVGGDDLEEFIENFFFPFVPASVTLTSLTTYYETGSTPTITLSGIVTANDETIIGTGSVRRSGIELYSFSSASSYSTSSVISASSTYQTVWSVGNDGSPANITSSARTTTFIYPYLYGTSSIAELTGSALYTAFMARKNYTTAQATKAVSMIGTNTYIYFAYPSTYSSLSSIKDPNNFEVLGSFSFSSSVAVTSSGLTNNWMENYKVYRLTLLADPNGTFTFTH
jgi:hypothetical protein